MLRKTKIICTIGPSSMDNSVLEALISNGMDIARINTSHTSESDAENIIKNIRKISKKLGVNTAIMLDLQGPKIRVGKLAKDILIKEGQELILSAGSKKILPADLTRVEIDYINFLDDIKTGCKVFIDDGLLELEIIKIDKTEGIAHARVLRGGVLKSRKGINLPGISVSAPSVTAKDIEYLKFGIDLGVDFIAQSFVRKADDILAIKRIIKSAKSNIMVIAKIEKYEAVKGFEKILACSDGIMIARGDLGIEIPEEDVPNIQKDIIFKSNTAGKPVITATQMLDSMIRNPRPTRAEVSDVANAIHDGSDALMLSGETAVGSFPIESLNMMIKIINKTESVLDYNEILKRKFLLKKNTITESISFAACEIANVIKAKAIITATQSGSTARQISKNRPENIIVGASPFEWVVRQLMISWGVMPVKTNFKEDFESMINEAVAASKMIGAVSSKDMAVITGGVMVNKPGSTNFINVKEID